MTKEKPTPVTATAFESITDARNAIMDFRAAHGMSLPEDIQPTFRELSVSPSPVDQIVKTGELLYARREELTPAASALAAGLISFAVMQGWHGLSEGGRGEGIVVALRRELGETPPTGSAWPDPEADPAPSDVYVLPAPQPAPAVLPVAADPAT